MLGMQWRYAGFKVIHLVKEAPDICEIIPNFNDTQP